MEVANSFETPTAPSPRLSTLSMSPTERQSETEDKRKPPNFFEELGWELLRPFRNQSHLVHLCWLAGSVLVWLSAYTLVVYLVGWNEVVTANTTSGVLARRNAGAIAGGVTGVYVGVMWIRGYGGPALNIVYLVGLLILLPAEAFTLFETVPEQVYRRNPWPMHPQSLRDMFVYLSLSLPGFTATLVLWAEKIAGPEQAKQWAYEHMPSVWIETHEELHGPENK